MEDAHCVLLTANMPSSTFLRLSVGGVAMIARLTDDATDISGGRSDWSFARSESLPTPFRKSSAEAEAPTMVLDLE